MGKVLKFGCLGLVGLLVLVVVIGVISSANAPKATVTSSTAAAPATASTAVAQGSSGAPPPVTAAPTTATLPKIGDTVTLGNWSYMVTKAGQSGQNIDTGNQFEKLDALGTWVTVYMTLKNVGKENFPINTSDFSLMDNSGVQSKVTDHIVEMDGWLTSLNLKPLGQQIPPGVSFNTAILFDVNPGATGFKLNLVQAKTGVDLGF